MSYVRRGAFKPLCGNESAGTRHAYATFGDSCLRSAPAARSSGRRSSSRRSLSSIIAFHGWPAGGARTGRRCRLAARMPSPRRRRSARTAVTAVTRTSGAAPPSRGAARAPELRGAGPTAHRRGAAPVAPRAAAPVASSPSAPAASSRPAPSRSAPSPAAARLARRRRPRTGPVPDQPVGTVVNTVQQAVPPVPPGGAAGRRHGQPGGRRHGRDGGQHRRRSDSVVPCATARARAAARAAGGCAPRNSAASAP